MDDDTRSLVRQLCTQAGMIMEDASLYAVTLVPRDAEQTRAAIYRLREDVLRMQALLAAAGALLSAEDQD